MCRSQMSCISHPFRCDNPCGDFVPKPATEGGLYALMGLLCNGSLTQCCCSDRACMTLVNCTAGEQACAADIWATAAAAPGRDRDLEGVPGPAPWMTMVVLPCEVNVGGDRLLQLHDGMMLKAQCAHGTAA